MNFDGSFFIGLNEFVSNYELPPPQLKKCYWTATIDESWKEEFLSVKIAEISEPHVGVVAQYGLVFPHLFLMNSPT